MEIRESEIAKKLEKLAEMEQSIKDLKQQAINNKAAAEILTNMVESGAAVLENDGSVTLKNNSVLDGASVASHNNSVL